MEKTPSFQVQSFGEYWLLERLAVGGMAEIFKAKQTGARGFEKIIVIKKILQHLSEDPEFVEMFEDEAKIAARLTQQNIVQIYELGEVNSQLYIAMEYVDGKNLRDLTRAINGKSLHLSIEQCVFLISEILKGLDYAHRKTDPLGIPLDIVHRDMSPQNIIISYEGEVKILDFGIAKAASKISKTEAGVLKGKFSYMSPEQASGRPISQTSDIYACGVILHELLTSDRLFRSKTDMETLERVKEGSVAPPSEKNDLIPAELDRIALKALAKDQERRYKTASEMLLDLNRFAFDQKYTYSSQDLAAFMKSLFADIIVEENARLRNALGRVPENSKTGNVKTHITFKRGAHSEEPVETSKKIKADITATADRLPPIANPKIRKMAIVGIFLMATLLAWFVLHMKSPSESDSESPSHNSVKEDSKDDLKLPDLPPVKKDAQPFVAPVDIPSTETKYERTDGRGKPKTSSSKPTKITRAQRMGHINIEAPQEGFAKLFINGQERGFVRTRA
jgi:serine/threonine protein kinase